MIALFLIVFDLVCFFAKGIKGGEIGCVRDGERGNQGEQGKGRRDDTYNSPNLYVLGCSL